MARKKKTESTTTTYLVMVHSDGRPADVLLPDGRMALLIPEHETYLCTRASLFNGVIQRHRSGVVEILSDEDESIEDIRESLIFDGDDPRKVKAMKIEKHPMVSFT